MKEEKGGRRSRNATQQGAEENKNRGGRANKISRDAERPERRTRKKTRLRRVPSERRLAAIHRLLGEGTKVSRIACSFLPLVLVKEGKPIKDWVVTVRPHNST